MARDSITSKPSLVFGNFLVHLVLARLTVRSATNGKLGHPSSATSESRMMKIWNPIPNSRPRVLMIRTLHTGEFPKRIAPGSRNNRNSGAS